MEQQTCETTKTNCPSEKNKSLNEWEEDGHSVGLFMGLLHITATMAYCPPYLLMITSSSVHTQETQLSIEFRQYRKVSFISYWLPKLVQTVAMATGVIKVILHTHIWLEERPPRRLPTVTCAYLQGEGESQVRLHRPTGWQHDLMGPQNPLGALENVKKEKHKSQKVRAAHLGSFCISALVICSAAKVHGVNNSTGFRWISKLPLHVLQHLAQISFTSQCVAMLLSKLIYLPYDTCLNAIFATHCGCKQIQNSVCWITSHAGLLNLSSMWEKGKTNELTEELLFFLYDAAWFVDVCLNGIPGFSPLWPQRSALYRVLSSQPASSGSDCTICRERQMWTWCLVLQPWCVFNRNKHESLAQEMGGVSSHRYHRFAAVRGCWKNISLKQKHLPFFWQKWNLKVRVGYFFSVVSFVTRSQIWWRRNSPLTFMDPCAKPHPLLCEPIKPKGSYLMI